MKYQEAVDLGLDTYVPDNPCERGHYHRKVKGRYCVECKKITDELYRNDPLRKAKLAEKQREYRASKGDEYRKYITEYMREYRKTERHKEWRKKYYDEVASPSAKRLHRKLYLEEQEAKRKAQQNNE